MVIEAVLGCHVQCCLPAVLTGQVNGGSMFQQQLGASVKPWYGCAMGLGGLQGGWGRAGAGILWGHSAEGQLLISGCSRGWGGLLCTLVPCCPSHHQSGDISLLPLRDFIYHSFIFDCHDHQGHAVPTSPGNGGSQPGCAHAHADALSWPWAGFCPSQRSVVRTQEDGPLHAAYLLASVSPPGVLWRPV